MHVKRINIMIRRSFFVESENQPLFYMFFGNNQNELPDYMDVTNSRFCYLTASETYTKYRNNFITIDCSDPSNTNEFIHINVINIEKIEDNIITFKDGMLFNLTSNDNDPTIFNYKYRQYKIEQLIN